MYRNIMISLSELLVTVVCFIIFVCLIRMVYLFITPTNSAISFDPAIIHPASLPISS